MKNTLFAFFAFIISLSAMAAPSMIAEFEEHTDEGGAPISSVQIFDDGKVYNVKKKSEGTPTAISKKRFLTLTTGRVEKIKQLAVSIKGKMEPYDGEGEGYSGYHYFVMKDGKRFKFARIIGDDAVITQQENAHVLKNVLSGLNQVGDIYVYEQK